MVAGPGSQALTAAQAERFKQALGLLQGGQAQQALAIARALASESPRAADAWQLLGMCLAGAGLEAEAEAAFERALDMAPQSAVVARNYGVFLARRGKALREQEHPEVAEPLLRKALSLAPELASAWVELGGVLRLLGRVEEGLHALRKGQQLLVRQRGRPSIDVANAINGALAEAGRPAEAIAAARSLVAEQPGHAASHETLSSLLWEYGEQHAPGEDPLQGFIAAAGQQPGNLPLQLSLARMMLATDRAAEALQVLQPLHHADPGSPLLAWFLADALDATGESARAASLYEQAARSELGSGAEFLNAWARHAFRSGRVELAARCAGQVVAIDPRNQEGWSHLGTAWRLQGDAREDWLCGYDRLVGLVEVEPPSGYADMQAFLRALGATLEAMHGAMREPVSQSVRGGTQTPGILFGRDDPVIHAAERALRSAAERWVASLPEDPAHPFLGRKQHSVRFTGSWSVRLRASGSHSNHIHPKGWSSSAFYVALPGSVRQSTAQSCEGWLQFGQPLETLGLRLPPRRLVQPREGCLALFPSYLWHGTVPFADEQPRLTIAFDMQPRA